MESQPDLSPCYSRARAIATVDNQFIQTPFPWFYKDFFYSITGRKQGRLADASRDVTCVMIGNMMASTLKRFGTTFLFLMLSVGCLNAGKISSLSFLGLFKIYKKQPIIYTVIFIMALRWIPQ